MGIGSLRRYHPTLDPKLAEAAGVQVGDRFNEEGNKSLDGVTTSVPADQAEESHVQEGGEQAITTPPTEEQIETLGGDPDQVNEPADPSGAEIREEEGQGIDETLRLPEPSATGSTADWHAYALQQGIAPARLEGLGREAIKALLAE